MTYLLDVNALIAVSIQQHQFHTRVELWLSSLLKAGTPHLATCSITELGFVRIISQIPAFGISLDEARNGLEKLKTAPGFDFHFISDNNDISHLPDWVTSAKHSTDGHLVELARSNSALLATLDENIPDSFLIP